MLTVDVQPPVQAQAGTVLYPPIVISSEGDAEYDFVQVALVDSYGRIIEGQPGGSLSTSPKTLNDESPGKSGEPSGYCVFPNLYVSYTGTFAFRVNGIKMDYNDHSGPVAVVVGSVTTREVDIYAYPVASEIPCSKEKSLLHKLRRSGEFGVPRAPYRR